jgi:sugar phosphate isomerase/epimerase
MTIKLAASSMLTRGNTPLEQLEFLKSYGFDGMELRLILSNEELPAYLADLQLATEKTGLKICSLITPDASFSQAFDRRSVMEAKLISLQRNLQIAGPIGAVSLFCPEYRSQIPLPLWNPQAPMTALERELLVELLSRAAEVAEKTNGTIILEPLNRYETHLIHRIDEALDIIHMVDSARIGILADFYHMNLEETDISKSISAAEGKIYHVQLADSNRLLPGFGHMDFQTGFRALHKTGYDRFMALECRAKDQLESDLPRTVQFLKNKLSSVR